MSKKNIALIAVLVGIFVFAFLSDRLIRTYVDFGEKEQGSSPHGGGGERGDGDDQEAEESVVHVPDHAAGNVSVASRVVLHEDGYVVIHEVADGKPGAILGNSGMLAAGEHQDVSISLDRTIAEGTSLIAMLHSDNGDGAFVPADDPPIKDEAGNVVLMPYSVQSGGE